MLIFVVPGLVYAVWRMRDQSYHCPYCDSENLVPARSDEARRLTRDFDDSTESD